MRWSPSLAMRTFRAADRKWAESRAASTGLWVLSALVLVAVLIHWPREGITTLDTSSYLEWTAIRTAGYPVALRVVSWFGAPSAIVPIQLSLYVCVCGLLAHEVRHNSRSAILGFAVVLGCARPGLLDWIAKIMTEGLFVPAVIAACALAMRAHRRPEGYALFGTSALIGIAAAVRPAGYALFPWLVVCALLVARPGWKRWVATFVPVLAVLLASSLAYRTQHDTMRAQAMLGLNLIGKAAFVDAQQVQTTHPRLLSVIDEQMRDPRRIDAGLEHWWQRMAFRVDHYDRLRFERFLASSQARASERSIAVDDLRRELAIDILEQAPGDYLYDVALNYWALWLLPQLQSRADLEAFEDRLGELGSPGLPGFMAPAIPATVVWTAKVVMMLLLLASLAGLVVAGRFLFRRGPTPATAAALGLMSVCIHAYFLLVALLQAGLDRYALVVWPLQIAVAGIAGIWLLDRWLDRAR